MNINRILRNVLIGGIFLLPFIPLVVSSSQFFPFITGKNFAFRILIEIMLGSWLILAYRDASFRPQKNWLLGAIALFVSVIAIADIFGENFSKSMWSNFERMEGLITLLHLLAYFVIAVSVLNTKKLWTRFFQVSLGASVIMGIYGLAQLLGGADIHQGSTRLDATLGNATYLAIYMLFHIFIGAFLYLRHQGANFVKWLYGGSILLNLFILYSTQTRGAILGLLAGVLLSTAIIAIFEKEKLLLRKISIGILTGIIALTGIFFLAKDTSFVKNSQTLNRFASISLDETTTKSRFMIWNMSMEGFKEHPVLGWGQENYNLVFNKYYNPDMWGQEQWFDRSHNVFFDWLIAGGILGLLSYLSIFGAALYLIWRRENDFSLVDKSVLTGLLAGYFFQNLFVFDNLISYFMFFSILGYLATVDNLHHPKEESVKEIEKDHLSEQIFVSIVIVSTLFTMYVVNIKGMTTSQNLIQSLSPQQEGLDKNLDYFKKILNSNSPFGIQEAREQLTQTAIRFSSSDANLVVKQNFFNLARQEMLLQIDEAPNDARHEFFLSSLLSKYKMYDEALLHIDRAIELSPKKQSIYFEKTALYLNKGDFTEALGVIKHAYELAPEFEEARKLYAITAVYAGNEELAKELLIPIYGTILIPDLRMVSAFVANGDYENVITIWEKQVELDPNNPQHHLSLAAAYLENGQRTLALEEIEKTISLNPSFKDQGEYYIKEIKAGRNP